MPADDRIVTLDLLELWAQDKALKLLLEAASCLVPASFYASPPPFEVSVANADGTEIAAFDGKWTWRTGSLKPELNLCCFYVTFQASKNFFTVGVCVAETRQKRQSPQNRSL